MTRIKEMRLKAVLSRAEMSRQFKIPIRTLECWESEKEGARRTPPEWAELLIIEKLDSLAKNNE